MRNILLTFLSDVKISDGGIVTPTMYTLYAGKEYQTKTTNESAVLYLQDYLNEQGEQLDKLCLIKSNKVGSQMTYQKEKIPGAPFFPFVEEGQEYRHIDYFLKQVASFNNALTKDCIVCDYDENQEIAEGMELVLAVATEIQGYIEELPENEEVTIHADLTGGMRHISMVMISLMRLLQYNNLTIGKVLYSNWQSKKVEEANNIYEFFDLVAGAEEFARFGSVEGIQKYYEEQQKKGKELSPFLTALLEAMKNFCQQIKLCRYAEFKDSITKLKEAVAAFREHCSKGGNTNDKMLSPILKTIEKEYASLWADDVGDLELIEWCIHRDYLQQAMTLYTERIPEYIGEKAIISVTDKYQQEFEEEYQFYAKQEKGSQNFYLFGNWRNDTDEIFEIAKKSLGNIIGIMMEKRARRIKPGKEFLQEIEDFKLEYPEIAEKIDGEKILEQVFTIHRYFKEQKSSPILNLEEYIKKFSCVNAIVQRYYEEDKNSTCMSWAEYLKEQDIGKINVRLGNQTNREFLVDVFVPDGLKPPCISRGKRIKEMVAEGRVNTKIDVTALEETVNNYHIVKQQRNNANHASENQKQMGIKELKELMIEGIKALKNI